MPKWLEKNRRIYRRCVLCRRTFFILPSQLAKPRRKGHFCTIKCYARALQLFSHAVATGRFEQMLKGSIVYGKIVDSNNNHA